MSPAPGMENLDTLITPHPQGHQAHEVGDVSIVFRRDSHVPGIRREWSASIIDHPWKRTRTLAERSRQTTKARETFVDVLIAHTRAPIFAIAQLKVVGAMSSEEYELIPQPGTALVVHGSLRGERGAAEERCITLSKRASAEDLQTPTTRIACEFSGWCTYAESQEAGMKRLVAINAHRHHDKSWPRGPQDQSFFRGLKSR